MNVVEHLRQLTPGDFAALGVEQIAYVKPVLVEGHRRFAIHAADGTQVAIVEDRDVAMATVVQHDLEPLSVH